MKTYTYLNTIPLNSVLNTNYTGTPMQLKDILGYSFSIKVTGTPTGTFALQGCNDPVNAPGSSFYLPTQANFAVISGTSYSISAAGTYLWNMPETFYNWVQLAYTDTSSGMSTAVITVSTFNAKGF